MNSGVEPHFPLLQGIRPFARSRLGTDVVAGITLAALGIPELKFWLRNYRTHWLTRQVPRASLSGLVVLC